MKIMILGPVYPYRGGIAHYNALMVRALAERHQVTALSYSLQYPDFLYPGKNQRDCENDFFKVDEARFLLNTVNPLSYLKTAYAVRKESPDLLIVQWWHPFFAPSYWTVAKLRGKCRLFFVCHNVFPHENFPMQRFLTSKVLRNGDAFIVHSELDKEHLLSIIKKPLYAKAVHPTYNAFRVSGLSKEEARALLGIKAQEKILLFFGFIREYKGLKTLVSAMPEICSALPECRLLIVGDFQTPQSKASYVDMIEKTGCAGSVTLTDGYIPDGQVERYFAACDLVVLPYDSATQSGIAQIAYGFEKPVAATDVGGLSEVVIDGKTGFLVPPGSPEKFAAAVVKFFTEAYDFTENIRHEAHKYSWSKMADVIEDLYAQLTSPRL